MPFSVSTQRQYTRMAVLNFLSKEGIAVAKPTRSGVRPDQRAMQLRAIGLNCVGLERYIQHTSFQIPMLYRVTGPITLCLFFVGIILMFVDLYFPFSRLNSVAYITWCLCLLSLYYTNKIALKDWKVRHGKE